MMTKHAILDDAMRLAPTEQLELAEQLLASVAVDEQVEAAWVEEIGRRLRGIDQGEAKLVPWDEALKRIAE